MPIIPSHGNTQVVIRIPPSKACRSAHLVDTYVWECMEPQGRDSFELHLMECTSCLRSVELERLLRRAIRDYKTSCGIPCATRLRRIR